MLTTVVIHTKTDTFKSISVAVTKLFLSKNNLTTSPNKHPKQKGEPIGSPLLFSVTTKITLRSSQCLGMSILGYGHRRRCLHGSRLASI